MPQSRHTYIYTVIYLLIVSALFYVNYNRIFDEKIDINGDNIYYYSLGNALADGKGFTNVMGFEESPHEHFPPGYPVFIALMTKCNFGSIHALKVTNGVLLYLSLIMLFFIFSYMGKNHLIAFTATAFAASHPSLLRFSTIMMSEMLYVFFTALTLLIVLYLPPEKLFSKAKKRWLDILLLLVLAGSLSYIYFIRTMGLSMILAVVLYYGIAAGRKFYALWKNRKDAEQFRLNKAVSLRYALMFGIVAVALIVPKMAWDARNRQSLGTARISYMSDFMNKAGGQQMSTFADWQERLKNNGSNYFGKWIPTAIFQHEVDVDNFPSISGKWSSAGQWLGGIIVLALMVFALYKSRKGLVVLLYLGATLGVLLLYYEVHSGHRYMTPIMPFLIFLFLYGCYEFIRWALVRYTKLKETKLAIYIISTAVCLVFTFSSVKSYAGAIKGLEQQAKFNTFNQRNSHPAFLEYIEAVQWVAQNTPETSRTVCRKSEFFYIFSGKRRSGGFMWYGTPEEIIADFENNRVDYVILDWLFPHAYRTIVPAIQKYPQRFQVVHQIGVGNDEQPATYVVKFLR